MKKFVIVFATLALTMCFIGCGKGGDSSSGGGSAGNDACDKAYAHLAKIHKSEWNKDIDPRAEDGLKNICVPSSSRLVTEEFSAKFVACIMACEKHSDSIKCFRMDPKQ